jgi:hypothetical protein
VKQYLREMFSWAARLGARIVFQMHPHITRPFTIKGREAYVVCLDCGREFAYDTTACRRLRRAPREVSG